MGIESKGLYLVCGLVAASIESTALAQQATKPVAYVGSSLGDDVVAVDLTTQKVIASIKAGHMVHGVCASPINGRTIYATIESHPYKIQVIDTPTNKITRTIELPGRPNECAVTNDGHLLIVPLVGNNSAVIVDTRTDKILKTLPLQRPHNCATPEGGSNTVVYCSERGRNGLNRIDLKTMEYTHKYPAGGDPRPFVLPADEKTAYVALSGLHGFAILDLVNRTIEEIVMPKMPFVTCTGESTFTQTHGIALTPDGKKMWITSFGDASVYIYDMNKKRIVDKQPTGSCPNWISISSSGKYAVVTASAVNTLSIYDAQTNKRLAEVPTGGKSPKRVLVVDVPVATKP